MKAGLEHLCAKLAKDPHLSEVYRPYLKEIRANSLLYMAILANTNGQFEAAREYLTGALGIDFRLLANQRFWRAARRAFLRLQAK
ncbi:MAG: hypothetical protein ACRD8U_12880, partial [Pyrinomonadaceae bacterium]